MAKRPSVRNGNLIKVANTRKAPAANDTYLMTYIEDLDGGNERPALLTFREFNTAARAELPFGMVKGRLYPVVVGRRSLSAVLLVTADGGRHTLLLPAAAIARWEARARRNPEDIPRKSLIADLLD